VSGHIFRKIIIEVIVPILLLLLPFIIPLFTVTLDVQTLSSIFSLIFAILVGFFIATATTNYINFCSYLADEGAYLISLYNFAKLVKPNVAKKLSDAIDVYNIATLDFSLMEYAKKTEKEFQSIVDLIDTLEPADNKRKRIAALTLMHEVKFNLIKTLRSITFTAPRVVMGLHWFILIILTVILSFLLFSLRTEELLSYVVTSVMILSLYLILYLLYEIDSNKFLEKQLAYEDPQKIFQAIGKPRYYPETAFSRGHAKIPNETYRVGIYKNFPESMEKTIKLFRK
jgi:hypothetical protein